jgi:hypothetical protein
LQLSSSPLHVSAGGLQAVQVHEPLQVRVPVEPQLVVQAPEDPRQHSPTLLSQMPSQSSSMPLQDSGGGVQGFQVQDPEQLRVPVEPQTAAHVPVAPRQQSKSSSQRVSPSSSMPLQASPVAVHVPQAQAALQVCEPGAPVDVVQEPACPWQQPRPLSQAVSQSSSRPLHDSAGGVQAAPFGIAQASEQLPAPPEPQAVVQETDSPTWQGKPSSVWPSQLSSTPLQDSVGDATEHSYSQPGMPSASDQPGRQRRLHVLASHTPSALGAPGQALPQRPQLSALVARLTQTLPQRVSGAVQSPAQTPPEQISSVAQGLPQPPQ